MFTLALEASHYESVEQFQEVIVSIRNVRDAWLIAAKNPDAARVLPRELRTKEELFATPPLPAVVAEEPRASRWSA
jgi:flagellar protein FliS